MRFHYEQRDSEIYMAFNEPLKFPAHLHKEVELVYIKQGYGHGCADGIDCTLTAGDFFIAFPNSVHYYDECQNMNATVIIFSLRWLSGYGDILSKMRPKCPNIKTPPKEAVTLMRILETQAEKGNDEVVRGLVLVLGILFDNIELVPHNESQGYAIDKILTYCEKNYKNEINIDAVARDLCLSPSYISHTFSDKLHLSFRDYINSLRTSDAVAMLKNGNKNITEIAYDCGFNTIRTFNRAFKKQHGMTPFEYKKRNFF